jgi:hypothetical protein
MGKRSMLIQIAAIAIAVLSAFASSEAGAFTVGCFTKFGHCFPGPGNHEDITRTALRTKALANISLLKFNGIQLGFAGAVLEDQIIAADVQIDSAEWSTSKIHFDAESFVDAQLRLQNLHKQIVALVLAGGDGSDARKLLGEALHTVQDFYAHSTWIDMGNSNIAPLGELNSAGAIADLLGSGIAEPDSTCSAMGLLPTGILTSEYPWPSAVGGTNSYNGVPLHLNKCAHGDSQICNNMAVCSPLENLSAGINKDTDRRSNFTQARLLAIQATTKYFTDILTELGSQGTGPQAYGIAACRLLGQPTSMCVPGITNQLITWSYLGQPLLNCDYCGPVRGDVVLNLPVNFTGYLAAEDSRAISATFRAGVVVTLSTSMVTNYATNTCQLAILQEYHFVNGTLVGWTIDTASLAGLNYDLHPADTCFWTILSQGADDGFDSASGGSGLDEATDLARSDVWKSAAQGTWTRR